MNYDEMNLIDPLRAAVREAGYETPTPIQAAAIPAVLAGKDVIGCAQTGTGKTAAFVLPILQQLAAAGPGRPRRIRALVVTATRELTLQNYDCFQALGRHLPLRAAAIYGGVNQAPQVEALQKGVDILAATPGRLNDLIGQGYVDLRHVTHFVLDEADRMLDMGFIHDVKRILTHLPADRQTLLFSATMPPEVEELARTMLRDPVSIKVDPVTRAAQTVRQSVCFLEKSDKNKLLLHLLSERAPAAALVFARTKHGADQITRVLQRNGVDALAIHGNKSQNARQTALHRFQAGEISVLVATDIAARGIDISELPYVINYNIPAEPETYIHRIGRTGRAGLEGRAISLCCSDELDDWRDIEKRIGQQIPVLETPWSVTDMQPTKAPAPGQRGRTPDRPQPAPKAEKPTEKARSAAQRKEKTADRQPPAVQSNAPTANKAQPTAQTDGAPRKSRRRRRRRPGGTSSKPQS